MLAFLQIFAGAQVPIHELKREVEDFTPFFLGHHDLMKWQGEDLKLKRAEFPRGTFGSTQDFSQNGALTVKFEHMSKYFNEISYTLYGVVMTFDARDLHGSAFEGVGGLNGNDAKAKVLKMFEDAKQRPLVTMTMLVVSTDLQHDPAFVQHVNDKLITPWVKTHANRAMAVHYVDSDGCPNQFDLSHQYLWISGQQYRHGIRRVIPQSEPRAPCMRWCWCFTARVLRCLSGWIGR